MQETTDSLQPEADIDERGVNLLDIALLFTLRWRMIAGLTLVCATAGALDASFRPKLYTAVATFITQSEPASGAIFIGRQADPTGSLLKSNSVADYVVRDANLPALQSSLKIPLPAKLRDPKLYYRSVVKSETKVEDGGDGLVSIIVRDEYPQRAVAISNAYLSALQDMTFRMNAESASIARHFFESQVADARRALEQAEQELRDAQARTGVLQPGSQTGQELGQISALRTQLIGLQVQRAMLSESSTPENPEMVRLAAQMSETQARINALQAKTHSVASEGLPTQNLELARLERNVSEHQAIVMSLGTQYEHAQMQERYTAPRVRTVDRAELPLPPASRQRALLTAIGAGVGLVLAVFITLGVELRRRLMSNPANAARVEQIVRCFRPRRA